jgi:hypothetical protein
VGVPSRIVSLVRLRFIPVFGAVSGWTTTEIGSVGKIEKVGLAERLASQFFIENGVAALEHRYFFC